MQRIALLESAKGARGPRGGSAASIALHVAVLAFAIAVTRDAGNRASRERAIYIPLPKWHPETPAPVQAAQPRPTHLIPNAPKISITVPTVIPSVIPQPTIATLPTTLGSAAVPVPGAAVGADTPAVSPVRNVPFGADEVDVAAAVLPGQRGPAYPEALRTMGIEGRVVARFVIGKNGRVEENPTITSSTDEQFTTAVKRYLVNARYRPATKNGEPVRQLAEQTFEFTLRR